MAYIEREALFGEIEKMAIVPEDLYDYGILAGVNAVREALGRTPAADVAPVVYGRFVLRAVSDVTSTFMCSECGREFEIANAYFGTPTNFPNKNYPYCNCGARMDGE